MDCIAIERQSEARAPRVSERLVVLWRKVLRRLSGWDRLYLDDMPDRIKRDLGFMDGREPRYEPECRR